VTSNGHDLDVSRIAHDGEKRLATGHDVNLGSGTSKADKRKVYQLKDAAATCLVDNLCAVEPRLLQGLSALNIRVSCLCGLVHLSIKRKRQVKRQTFVITSGNYLAKVAEETDKQVGRREREEANQGRKNNLPKRTAERKIFKELGNNLNVIQCALFAK
jgi:hypothetical protein